MKHMEKFAHVHKAERSTDNYDTMCTAPALRATGRDET